jgi:hypothetical protein
MAVSAFVSALSLLWRFVEFHDHGCDGPVRFQINRAKDGRVTFTDTRDGTTGIAGTTGIWGTLAPLRPERPRSMTPTAFKREAARLVGMDTAEQILVAITQGDCFSTKKTQMQDT